MRKHGMGSAALLALLAIGLAPAVAFAGKGFSAQMAGIGDSAASGEATFTLSDDGNALHYKVTVSNIENLSMSHIHIAPAGMDGPAAVWLYPSAPPPQPKEGKFEGTLAEGDITAAELKGPLEGKPLSALIEKMEAGETYANVHTKQKPGGEIRGQIKPQ